MNFANWNTQDWIELARTVGGIVITAILGILFLRLARKGLETMGRKNSVSPTLVKLTNLFLRWTVWIVVLLLVLTQLGVKIGSIWAILSALAAMVAIGFVAVWSLLSNISCTVLLLIFHPFSIGDEIEIIEATGGKGLRGRVVNLNFMYTVIEETDTETGEIMITQVPNNTFFQKTVRRRPGKRTVNLDEHVFRENTPDVAKEALSDTP